MECLQPIVLIIAAALLQPGLSAQVPIESARIIGGVPSTTNEFPYQISLRYNNGHICGGSIIAASFVVTAAHCIISTDPSVFSIQAGILSIRQANAGQIRAVSRLIVNPQYNSGTNQNDIAILALASPLTFGPAVSAIALPDTAVRILAGDELVITGWGTTQEGGSASPTLRKAIVPAVALAQCRSAYGAGAIFDSMICAGQAGRDTCQGDSGGPLATSSDSPRTLIGITSFGNGCGRANYPGVYTRVSSFRSFIRAHAGV